MEAKYLLPKRRAATFEYKIIIEKLKLRNGFLILLLYILPDYGNFFMLQRFSGNCFINEKYFERIFFCKDFIYFLNSFFPHSVYLVIQK